MNIPNEMSPSARLGKKRFLFGLTATLLSTLSALAVCELVLRALGLGYGSQPTVSAPILHHAHPPNYTFVSHTPSEEYGGHVVRYDGEGYVTDPHHELRPGSASGGYRAAFMGDSFIEATQVSYPDSFVGRLAKYGSARTVVRNFGVTSYSPIFYVLQWRHHVKRFRPTHVFVLLFSNDPDTDRHMVKQATYSQGKLQALPGPGGGWITVQLRRSFLARLIRKVQLKARWMAEHPEAGTSRTVGGHLEENPDISEPTTGFLKQLRLEVEQNDAQLVLLAVPSKYRIVNRVTHDPAESDPEFSDKVARWANANGIQFIDLVEPFERATDQGVSCFFEEDIHFRASGHHVVADSIRAYFPELFGEPTENQPGM